VLQSLTAREFSARIVIVPSSVDGTGVKIIGGSYSVHNRKIRAFTMFSGVWYKMEHIPLNQRLISVRAS